MPARLADLRVVFIGIGTPFATASLRAIAWNCNLVGIVESVAQRFNELDDPMRNFRSGMRRFANHRRIPWTLIADRGPRLGDFLRRRKPDIICVAGMKQLLRADEWSVAPLGALNLHPTVLPNYRGPQPTFWQYHDTDLVGGVTIHQIDAGIDTGDILTQTRFPIPLGCRPLGFFYRCSTAGANAMLRALAQLQNGTSRPVPQRALSCPRYARMTHANEQFIDYHTWSAERVWHFLRGTHFENKCLALPPGEIGDWSIGSLRRHPANRAPGIVYHDAGGHHVALRDGSIDLRLIHRMTPRRTFQSVLGRLDYAARWC